VCDGCDFINAEAVILEITVHLFIVRGFYFYIQ
jgi:hypothetical protein